MIPERIPSIINERIRLCDPKDAQIILRQFQYHPQEDILADGFSSDPVGDGIVSVDKLPCLLHKYTDRLLIIANDYCNVFCRFCFRRNNTLVSYKKCSKKEIIKYITSKSEIHEIILSGGEPFLLKLEEIEDILVTFFQITQVQRIRIHTRAQWTSPWVFKDKLFWMIEKLEKEYKKKVSLVFHINHPCEMDKITDSIFSKWRNIGIEIKHQMVLLKGINDSVDVLEQLFIQLQKTGVKPYYIHHLDKVEGASLFYIPINEGKALIQKLLFRIKDFPVLPDYVIDSPEGKKRLF